VKDYACDGFGGSSSTSLFLIKPNGEENGPFFAYQWAEADPILTWSNGTTLLVTIKHAHSIDTQLPELGPIKISYKIGSVSP
jgi:hypothetical protein